jgi:methylase of polypeptide subunit release factors
LHRAGFCPRTVIGMDEKDQALVALGRELQSRNYRFTTITPASHRRVNNRAGNEVATSLEGVLGWSRPFRRTSLPEQVVALLDDAGEMEASGSLLRSKVRFSTLGAQLFVHSAFPTDRADAVFFGPDTYRFVRSLAQSLDRFTARARCRIIDIGCGSGAGGLCAAARLAGHDPEIVLADINPRALRFSRINGAINGVAQVETVESDLFANVPGRADLIIANPPYLVDPLGRLYRHGGGELGFDLSLRVIEQGIDRLAPGGRLFVYTGSPVIDGTQMLLQALSARLSQRGCSFAYDEIDPDVFGEELENPPYDRADRIAAVAITVDAGR